MLNKEQKRQLAAKAHHLKTVVMIGNNGVTENVINEIDVALTAHELIKVKVAGADRDEKTAMINDFCEKTRSELIKTIGHIAIIYRKRPATS